jgi:diguanylate cyclase (GGDEF)-like protein
MLASEVSHTGVTPGKPPDEAALVARDIADLLYKHAVGGIGVSVATSTLLVLIISRLEVVPELISWWTLMQITLLLRAIQVYRWTKIRPYFELVFRDANRETRQFILGAATTAFFWVIFPLFFFKDLDLAGRATLAILLSGMAGGSTIVLAAKQSLSIGFCAALLLPTSLLFLAEGSRESVVLGFLGFVFFGVMSYSARVAHHATMRSVRLGRANDVLLRGMENAQQALRDSNAGLEIRVRSRTEELTREIQEKERYSSELARLARQDALTGLYNRSSLTERLETAIAEAAARNTPGRATNFVAVLFIDLDKFKEVNDVRGHFAGDQVLRTVARRLSNRLGTSADLARWGGDEFVVVLRQLNDPDGLDAMLLANTLCDGLAQPIDIEPEPVVIGATVGIAIYPEHGKTQEDLIRAADVAMYEAKQDRAASRIRMFDQALADDLARRHRFAQSLGRAIAEDALSILFQPIVVVPGGHCLAMEALLRWRHPELGLVPPSEFIPLAERSGDIVAIGRWVLIEACRIAVTWPGEDPPAVSINVSTAQVTAGCLVDDVCEAMRRSGLPPRRLHIELTESLFAGNQERVGPTLQALREMGVRISLDDFGTGFSSLAYLQSLPVDTIKIDKKFVDDIEGESRSIVNAIVSISKALDFELIAEGVETERQMSTLISMGVASQQGYLLARPLTEKDVAPWLSRLPKRSAAGSTEGSALQALALALNFQMEPTAILRQLPGSAKPVAARSSESSVA